MIDTQERHNLSAVIAALVKNEATWDDLHAYLQQEHSEDLAIHCIGYCFWITYDPEFPDNAKHIDEEAVARCLLFLETSDEYIKPKIECAPVRFVKKLLGKKVGIANINEIPYWPFSSQEAYIDAKEKSNRLGE